MKWTKLGKIFNPLNHNLPNSCHGFAQSPQSLVFDNFIRVYFSTRKKDGSGKYLSYISFVDFDRDFQSIINVSNKEVIKLGDLGCFDEHGIFPMNVLREDNHITAFLSGWNRKISVLIDGSIGIATSKDNGLTYQRLGPGPILTSSLHEPFLVGDPFVIKVQNKYHMWYIYGKKWVPGNGEREFERVYKIGHAISYDKLNWEKDNTQIICDKINSNECQALPTVFEYNNQYHMYFCYRDVIDFRLNKDKSYKIGYAKSSNLKDWKRMDSSAGIEVSKSGWDSEMMCYPHTFKVDNKIYMLYNGNDFGKLGFGLAKLNQ
jgi:hypothetical protein